jgi:hypothetical protein
MASTNDRRRRVRRSLLTIVRVTAAGLALTGPCATHVVAAAMAPDDGRP